MKCEKCSVNEAKRQVCNGDGRYHHHGGIHVKGLGLMAVCDQCAADDRRAWGPRPWDKDESPIAVTGDSYLGS